MIIIILLHSLLILFILVFHIYLKIIINILLNYLFKKNYNIFLKKTELLIALIISNINLLNIIA